MYVTKEKVDLVYIIIVESNFATTLTTKWKLDLMETVIFPLLIYFCSSGTRPSERYGLNRTRLTTARSEDGDSATKDIDSRRKLYERTRPSSSPYLSRLNNEDSKDSKRSEETKDKTDSKTNQDNTKKDEVGIFLIF